MNQVKEVQYIFALIFETHVFLTFFKQVLTYVACTTFLSLSCAGPQYATAVQSMLILALALKFLPLSMLSLFPDFPPAAGDEVTEGVV